MSWQILQAYLYVTVIFQYHYLQYVLVIYIQWLSPCTNSLGAHLFVGGGDPYSVNNYVSPEQHMVLCRLPKAL